MKPFLAAITLALISSKAVACDEFVTLDRAQTSDLVATMQDADSSTLDQYFAFETLMCSDQSGVRDITLRQGAISSNPTIQGQVVLRALLEKEVIAVELVDDEGLSKEHYNVIESKPFEMLNVTYRSSSESCIGFIFEGRCEPSNSMTISGTRVVLNNSQQPEIFGKFDLTDNMLTGTVTIKNLTFPAKIDLF